MPFAEVSHRFLFMYFGGAQIRKRGSRGRVRGFLGWGNFREMRSTAGVWRTGMPSNAAQKCCDGARRFPRRIGILTRCVLCVSAGGGIVYFRRNQVVRSMPFFCAIFRFVVVACGVRIASRGINLSVLPHKRHRHPGKWGSPAPRSREQWKDELEYYGRVVNSLLF